MRINKILIMVIVSILMSTGALASNQDITIMLDGSPLKTNCPPQIVNDSTLVPARAIFEAMGANVEWIDSTRTVIGTRGSDVIELQIGSTIAKINGQTFTLKSPAIIIGSSTMAPVRFIAESLGATVGWDGDTRTVIINSTYKPDNSIETEVLRLVNIERTKAGLKQFKMSSELSKVARIKSQDMADNKYFSHTSPTYGSAFDMMDRWGINFNTAGENIAMGYSGAQSVVNGWMNSPAHRDNILNGRFNTLGVGYVKQNGTTYWTQMFTN